MDTTPREVSVELSIDTSGFERAAAKAARASRDLTVQLCKVCQHYMERRLHVLPIVLVHVADQHGVDPKDLFSRYMWSVHQRHLAGGSLSTRPRTGTVKSGEGMVLTVARACNGCGESLGDARPAELDAAVDGTPLPDVTLECGCAGREAA